MRPTHFISGVVLTLALALAGCRQEEVRSYSIPKERTVAPARPSSPHGSIALPRLRYETPPQWEERPASGMRAASFNISNPDGASADVIVVPMGRIDSNQIEIVNLWRRQVGLSEITQAELKEQTQTVQIGDQQGELYQMPGAEISVAAAVAHVGDTSWFFKMTGPPALIESQLAPFRQFLASVRLPASGVAQTGPMTSAAPSSPPAAAEANPGRPSWKVPAEWRETAPSMMTMARFVFGPGDAAEVTVTPLAGAAGGFLANVNRWRGQLGLGPIGQDELDQTMQPLDRAGTGAMLVEMTGKNVRAGGAPAAMVVAVVPQPEQTWFYKLMGDPAVVAEAKQAFIQFVQSVNYSDG